MLITCCITIKICSIVALIKELHELIERLYNTCKYSWPKCTEFTGSYTNVSVLESLEIRKLSSALAIN